MKKLIFLLCVSLMLFLVCAKAKSQKKYLALGDSITEGYTIEDKSKIYASLFAKKHNFELTNEAVSGDKSGVLLEKLANYNVDDYDVITLCIGANNVLRPFLDKVFETSADKQLEMILSLKEDEEFNKEMDKGIEELDKDLTKIMKIVKSGHAQIYYMNVYNPYQNNVIQPLGEIADYYVGKINDVIEKHKDGVHFINLHRYFASSKAKLINSQVITGSHFMDPHPTGEGQKYIAQLLNDEYDRNNITLASIILIIVLSIFVLIVEVIDVIYTFKSFAVKKAENIDIEPKLEKEEEKKNDSSRFIRS